MALPLSPSTTYVASGTPSIKAADLNDLQSYLAHAYNGTRTLKAVKVDGVGGVVATPEAGTLQVSATSNAAQTLGKLYKDIVPVAWAQVLYSGGYSIVNSAGFDTGYGVTTTGVGLVKLKLWITAPTPTDGCVIANVETIGVPLVATVSAGEIPVFGLVNISLWDLIADVLADHSFHVVVFAK